jgi:hypothetical protein
MKRHFWFRKESPVRKSALVRGSWLLLGAAIFMAASAVGRSQEQLAGKAELEKSLRDSEARLRELFSGNDSATKADKKHADAAAQWFLYRLTIKAYLTPTKDNPNPVERMHDEFHKKVAELMDKKNKDEKVEFRKLFAAAVVGSMKNVLASREFKTDPSTVIHAMQMLPDMARLKQDEVSAYLCELAKDDKNPVVQLYAIKALKETMPVVLQPDADDFAGVNQHNARKARDIKNVDALKQIIERPVNVTGMTPEEIKAVIFIRREAIISLAQAGAPAVVAVPNKKMAASPEGAAAHTLMNVLAGNLQPPATLQEKVEAALGLCSMKYPNMPEYEPQVAVYLVGRTLNEFVTDYGKDWANFTAGGAGKRLPYLPYMGDAKRFKAALKELSANTPSPYAKTAKELEAKAVEKILDKIIGKNDSNKYGALAPDDVNQLKEFTAQLRPKTGYIFKTLKIAEIPLGK